MAPSCARLFTLKMQVFAAIVRDVLPAHQRQRRGGLKNMKKLAASQQFAIK
jgi:hypothetical protein